MQQINSPAHQVQLGHALGLTSFAVNPPLRSIRTRIVKVDIW